MDECEYHSFRQQAGYRMNVNTITAGIKQANGLVWILFHPATSRLLDECEYRPCRQQAGYWMSVYSVPAGNKQAIG